MVSKDSAAMQYYYDLMKKHPVLPKEEEMQIVLKAKKGDKNARELLVKHNIGIVISLANKLMVRSLLLEDLVQEGMAGFVHAIDDFEPKKGFRLSTYASWWVNAYIRKYLSNNSAPVRIPRHKRKHEDKPSIPISVSMSTPVGPYGDLEYVDMFADEETKPVDEAFEDLSLQKAVRDKVRRMRSLGPIGRDIVYDRLMSDEPKTLAEIGKVHNLSRERIRQLEMDVKDNLRKRLIDYAA